MRTPAEYLSDIVNQKKSLIKTLTDKGVRASEQDSLENLVTKVEQLDTTCFYSSKDEIVINAKGSGVIRVICEEDIQERELNEENYTQITFENTESTEKIYFIENINNITELDISNNGITKFLANEDNRINKFVIYNNLLNELDVSSFKEIQFLHMFTNPLCDEEEYEENLKSTIGRLPDRTNKAMGSIVFYPWYGLETLIEKVEDEYYKYPYSGLSDREDNINHQNNPYHRFIFDNNGYIFEDERLYGLVDSNNKIIYHTYKSDKLSLVEHTTMNRHHTIRKDLEKDYLLGKYWVVGSAIMYHDDYERCPWDFKQLHIADIWETAEKGFGVTLGSIDKFTLLFPEIKYMNVRSFNAEDNYPSMSKSDLETYLSNTNDKNYHGDSVYSPVIGYGCDRQSIVMTNGNYRIESDHNTRFGISPLCDCVFWNKNSGNFAQQLKDFCDANKNKDYGNCDVLSTSTSYSASTPNITDSYNDTRHSINSFAETKIVVNSAGNSGDGRPYTHSLMNFTVDDYPYLINHFLWGNSEKNGISTHFQGYHVPSIDNDKNVSYFSQSSQGSKKACFVTGDYISSYGNNIVSYSNRYINNSVKGLLKCVRGTSYASPLLAGQFILLINIYKKLFPKDSYSFGKDSEFMYFVKKHWLVRLDNNMDFATGIGMLDAFAQPINNVKLLDNEFSSPTTLICNLGEGVEINYGDCGKHTFTPEYKFNKFAITRKGKIYPLVSGDNTIKIYSNTSRHETRLVEDGIQYYGNNYFSKTLTIKCKNGTVTNKGNESTVLSENINNDIAVFKTNSNTDEFTIFINTDFTFNEKFGLDNVSKTSINIPVAYYKENNSDILKQINIGNVSSNNNGALDMSHGQLTVACPNDSTIDSYKICGYVFNDITEADGYLSIGDVFTPAVITITKSKNDLLFYYNGTYQGKVADVNVSLNNFYVDKTFLCHDDSSCVKVYERCFTDDEVAQNTVAILNQHNN